MRHFARKPIPFQFSKRRHIAKKERCMKWQRVFGEVTHWRSDALAKWRYDEVMFRNDASLAKWCVFTAEVTLRAVLRTFKSAWIKKWFSCHFDRKLPIKFGEKSCQRRQKELLWLIYLENTIDFLKIEHVFSSKFVRTVSLRLLPYQLILYLYTSFRETKPSKAETF